jgi:hypothetical protein
MTETSSEKLHVCCCLLTMILCGYGELSPWDHTLSVEYVVEFTNGRGKKTENRKEHL